LLTRALVGTAVVVLTRAFDVPLADCGFDRNAELSVKPASADLALIVLQKNVRLLPASLLGVLWLQTHFESRHRPSLAAAEARLDAASSEQLAADAEAAGLPVVRTSLGLPSLTSAVATQRQPGPG